MLVVSEKVETCEDLEFLSAQGEKPHLEVAEVSLNFVVGLKSPHTMKVKGVIKRQEVVVFCVLDFGCIKN